MANDWFSFKRFTVHQAGAAMKVGTDGTLLGAWACLEGARHILDIGTGTGLIALMAAQRTEASGALIDGIEIDAASAAQAADNFAASPWSQRIHAIHSSIQDFTEGLTKSLKLAETPDSRESEDWAGGQESGETQHWTENQESRESQQYTENQGSGETQQYTENPELNRSRDRADNQETAESRKYDHILSNPPYFVASLPSPNPSRTVSRHACSLTYEELTAAAARLLAPDGALSVIIPADSETRFTATAAGQGLTPSRRTVVFSLPDTPPKRILLEFIPNRPGKAIVCEQRSLTIGTSSPGEFSEEYRSLTKHFYLKF